jgi:hypothetical protein
MHWESGQCVDHFITNPKLPRTLHIKLKHNYACISPCAVIYMQGGMFSLKSEPCACIMYFIEGEENPKLQTNSEGSSKVAPDRLESTSEIIDGKLVW